MSGALKSEIHGAEVSTERGSNQLETGQENRRALSLLNATAARNDAKEPRR
jgi:hypothetical protein